MLEHAPASGPEPPSSGVPPGVGLATGGAPARQQRRAQAKAERSSWQQRDRYVADLAASNVRLRKLQAKLDMGALPRAIPRDARRLCALILADATGHAGGRTLRRLSNRVYAGAVVHAAFVPLPGGGFRYGWADARARAIVALGCVLHFLSTPTRRGGRWGGGIVRGITEGALRMLLANPWDSRRKPSRSTLAGTHRPGATVDSGQVGWLVALKQVGALYGQQLPVGAVEPFERWPSVDRDGNRVERASNRYWLVTERADAPDRPAVRDRLHSLRALAEGLFAGVVKPLRELRTALRAAAAQGPPPAPLPP